MSERRGPVINKMTVENTAATGIDNQRPRIAPATDDDMSAKIATLFCPFLFPMK